MGHNGDPKQDQCAKLRRQNTALPFEQPLLDDVPPPTRSRPTGRRKACSRWTNRPASPSSRGWRRPTNRKLIPDGDRGVGAASAAEENPDQIIAAVKTWTLGRLRVSDNALRVNQPLRSLAIASTSVCRQSPQP